MHGSLQERFEAKYTPEPNSGCWLWTDALNFDGYGHIGVETENGWEIPFAHRVSFEMHKGPIPEGMCVLHKCDVRSCVNPDHLWLGTRKENNADRDEKGRQVRFLGEAHGNARLTDDAVRHIRRKEMSQRAYARLYGVSKTVVGGAQRGQFWKHVN